MPIRSGGVALSFKKEGIKNLVHLDLLHIHQQLGYLHLECPGPMEDHSAL